MLVGELKHPMSIRILGIESSCDETAAAVVIDGREILSSVVASQIDIHGKYGGVVPELASREHLRRIVPVVREAVYAPTPGGWGRRPRPARHPLFFKEGGTSQAPRRKFPRHGSLQPNDDRPQACGKRCGHLNC